MEKVRFGIIGAGNIGTTHTNYFVANEIKNAELVAVCDNDPKKVDAFKAKYPETIKYFSDYKEMLNSDLIDAVLIATPHYDHPQMAIDCFAAGKHVIVEKPSGVFTKNVLEMNKAAKESGKVFSIMFCMRTNTAFCKIKEMIDSGELGTLKRINWIATDWYRPQAYHDSSSWRSSWKGEGGGLIINQCPHNLDLWQWMFGVPDEITAFADFGKYYDIEVEDEATVYMRYNNGVTGVFIASTGEAPGTNRLEVAGTKGQLILENNELTFKRNRVDEREFNASNTEIFGKPEVWECKVPFAAPSPLHQQITQNFVNAILNGEQLIAPGTDGIVEMDISNAIHMSAWTGKTIKLPVDTDAYLKLLEEKINN